MIIVNDKISLLKEIANQIKTQNAIEYIEDVNKPGTYIPVYTPDLNMIDVSRVTDFSNVFAYGITIPAYINPKIDKWNVSSGYYFSMMFFKQTYFDQDLSAWIPSYSINDVSCMFWGCTSLTHFEFIEKLFTNDKYSYFKADNALQETNFNGDISQWNFGAYTNGQQTYKSVSCSGLFSNCHNFNPDFDMFMDKMRLINIDNIRYIISGTKIANEFSKHIIGNRAIKAEVNEVPANLTIPFTENETGVFNKYISLTLFNVNKWVQSLTGITYNDMNIDVNGVIYNPYTIWRTYCKGDKASLPWRMYIMKHFTDKINTNALGRRIENFNIYTFQGFVQNYHKYIIQTINGNFAMPHEYISYMMLHRHRDCDVEFFITQNE